MAKQVTGLLHVAVSHHRSGRLDEARKAYEQILRADPKHPDALQMLGLLLIERGMAERGFQLLRRAVAYAPRSVEAANNLAVELARAGRLEEAIGWFDRVLALDPANPDVLYNRACALRDLGRLEDALASYERVTASVPAHGAAWSDRGLILRALGRLDAALASFAAAPDHPAAQHNAGLVLHALGRIDEALAAYDRALAAGAENPDLLSSRAAALLAAGRYVEAKACCDEALARQPDDAETLFNLGNALRGLRRHGEALAAYERSLAVRPDFPEALNNRAITLLDLGRYVDAAQAFEALPATDYAPGRLLHARQFVCDWHDFAARSEAVEHRIDAGAAVEVPFMALAHVEDARRQRRCAELYVADKIALAPEPMPPRTSGQRVRLAYLSGDFGDHPISYLMAGVFERHDRARFETIAVSFRPPEESPIGRRIRNGVDRFLDVSQSTDAELVALLRAAEIDIAIDLMGHTAGSRMPVLARRVAPVQISYLGYPGTSGLAAMDYLIGDAIVVPAGCEASYSEQIIRLAGCFQANDDRREAAPHASRADAGLPEHGFVFGAFNNTYKITQEMFAVWMRLLGSVADSVLWIYAPHPAARANLSAAATAHGVDPARLIFAGRVPYPAHLARLALVDLALDTYPFNGGTTTSDLLWAGTPVVTRAGEAFASRMGASLLHAVGWPELAVSTVADYESVARRLAEDPVALRGLRAGMDRSCFDTAAFTRRLEAAYLQTLANPAVEA